MPLCDEIGRKWRAAIIARAEAEFATIVRNSGLHAGVDVRSRPAQPNTRTQDPPNS
jgi:hypothetical protein